MKLHKLNPMSHYSFLEAIAKVWVQEGTSFFDNKKKAKTTFGTRMKRASSTLSIQSQASSQSTLTVETRKHKKEIKTTKNKRINESTLDPFKGSLKMRLDHTHVQHWPCPVTKKDTSCQLHYWATGKRCRKQMVQCELCEVTLCVKCFQPFHTEPKIGKKQEYYRKLYSKDNKDD